MPLASQGGYRMHSSAQNKWWILAVVTLVAFVTNIDSTIVVVGLPRMVAGLHISVTTGLWTLTAYILTSTVFLLPAGRWSDLVGRKRIFMIGLLIFTVATLLCGFTPSGTALVLFRLLQGSGAALALATATPILVQSFPQRELGRAIGINSTSWVLGAIVGPVVGGILVGTVGWRSIFFVTAPFALLAVIGAWRILPSETAVPPSRTSWDRWGALTFGAGLAALLLTLSLGQPWGWLSVRTLAIAATAVALLAAFVLVELRDRLPMFDFALLRHPHYRAGLAVTVSYSIAYFAVTFLLTIYLQGAVHLSPLVAGLMLIPFAAPQLVMGPVGGSLADRYGSGRLVTAGVLLLAGGDFWLGHLGARFSPWAVVLPCLLMSAANGLAWPALTKAVMASAPAHRTGSASGMFYTFRNVGMALSLTLALTIAEASLPPATATEAFVGASSILNPHLKNALVHATDTGFSTLVLFFLLALAVAVPLLRPHSARELATESPKPAS